MAFNLTLSQLVEEQLPAGFTVSAGYLEHRLMVNQLMIYEAAGLTKEDAYTWENYPDEWKLLLGYLVVYDVLNRIITGAFITSVGDVTQVGDESGEGGGSVKKIVTGPTEVEFHDTNKSLGDLMKSLMGEGGIFTQFLMMACGLASKLGIQLPFCRRSNGTSCIGIVHTKFPHAGFNGLTYYAKDKPKSVG
jgi:hypothetical protein